MPSVILSFNPAEAEEWFSRRIPVRVRLCKQYVSIQPKPKKGLVDARYWRYPQWSNVSIQPKPKNGLAPKSPKGTSLLLHKGFIPLWGSGGTIQPKPKNTILRGRLSHHPLSIVKPTYILTAVLIYKKPTMSKSAIKL